MPHVIRLRGAWEAAAEGNRVRHARNFGRPRTLDPGERVWLVCRDLPGPAEVFLNERSLGAVQCGGDFSADITEVMVPRNRLLIEVAGAGPAADVSIEIRPAPVGG